MNFIRNAKNFIRDIGSHRQHVDQAKHYADVNKDGRLDKQDFEKVRSYTNKLHRK